MADGLPSYLHKDSYGRLWCKCPSCGKEFPAWNLTGRHIKCRYCEWFAWR